VIEVNAQPAKTAFLPAGDAVMSAEFATGDFSQWTKVR